MGSGMRDSRSEGKTFEQPTSVVKVTPERHEHDVCGRGDFAADARMCSILDAAPLPVSPVSPEPTLALLSRLLHRVDAKPCTSIAEWLPRWRRTLDASLGGGPFAGAVAAALEADRLAWAFFSGYQGALHAAFPALLRSVPVRAAALCANETGRRLTDIRTALHASDGAWRLEGTKAWLLAGIDALDLFVLARAAGGPPSGPGSLVIVRVPSDAPGVVVSPPRAQRVVPELPHASVEFRDVRIADDQIQAGDGYADVAKPFRLREDVFVTGCTLAFLLSQGHRAAWPSVWRQRTVAAIATLERCAALLPSDARTEVLAAGALADAGDLIEQVDGFWTAEDAGMAERWRRDKPLLELGAEARRQRILKAWARIDGPSPEDSDEPA
jgi:hypothetical protein